MSRKRAPWYRKINGKVRKLTPAEVSERVAARCAAESKSRSDKAYGADTARNGPVRSSTVEPASTVERPSIAAQYRAAGHR